MRRFSSYGPVDPDLHYFAPRKELIAQTYQQLVGDAPDKGGHYITVWAPRQTGKSWLMLEILRHIKQQDDFETALLSMQSAKEETTDAGVLEVFVRNLRQWFQRDFPPITEWKDLETLFTRHYFAKPVILMVDEFDAIDNQFINKFANEFRNMHLKRTNETDRIASEKTCRLHGLALIGVRSVLGIENVTGSPFNVQRSVHIPNLTLAEVEGLFRWYERESGQPVEQAVIEHLYAETKGQPGLTCWFGELLTEGFEEFHPDLTQPLTLKTFERVYTAAVYALPNNNILNIVSKAKQPPYKEFVLELFKTEAKMLFKYDDPAINYLYMNGVVSREMAEDGVYYLKFASPFVQKRLFNYFSNELFQYMGKLYEPFENLSDVIAEHGLIITGLAKRFERYLQNNRAWLLRDAPRRKDLRIYEAVFHFCFYRFLCDFLGYKYASVYPEFPTGNGKIDLIITYQGIRYGIELKSFTNERDYHEALSQAARYGQELRLTDITLIAFIEYIDDEHRQHYEAAYHDPATGVTVAPVFVVIGR